MPPKDYIVYVDKDNETRACLAYGYVDRASLEKEGCTVIGYVSSGKEADAIQYGNEVLRWGVAEAYLERCRQAEGYWSIDFPVLK